MLLEYYQIIKQRLATITNPRLKEIDWYYGQFLQNEENILYVDGGAYIEFEPIQWAQMGRNMQQATLGFNIHLVQEALYDNDERILNASLGHLQLVGEIYAKLQGYGAWLSSLPAFSALANTPGDKRIVNEIVRTESTPDHTFTNLLVTVQRFQSTVLDVSATPEYQQTIINNLNITADYV